MRGLELKDGLADGRWGDEGWIRDGMRLVWRGRIVRDEEELGQVVKDVSPPLMVEIILISRRVIHYTPSTWSHVVSNRLLLRDSFRL